MAIDDPVGADIPVITGDDLSSEPQALASLLRCGDLKAPAAQDVVAFEGIRWTPSSRLLEQVGSTLWGGTTFALVGDQQGAFVGIRAAAQRSLPSNSRSGAGAERSSGAVITVQGGPGSGKTALAVRLLGHFMRKHPWANPRFVTPSGTLRAHLLDAVREYSAARELFVPASSLRSATRDAQVVIIDEAQRISRTGKGLAPELVAALQTVPLVVVVFLDERQIICPDEGTSVAEIRSIAHASNRQHHHLPLNGAFRCNGSKAFTEWVDQLLYGTPLSWHGHAEYDLGMCEGPFQLEQWIEQANAAGHLARTSAGFCWRWTRTRRRGASALPLDITIDTSDPATGRPRAWKAAWNAYDALTGTDGALLAPRSQLWATHPGGHQQIGCVYTAQGMEYHHAGVLIGPDLTWDKGQWTAHPEASQDRRLRGLSPAQYLPLALNIYRVLLTRGTHATRIHATDPTTQHFLQRLIR
ncbi:DNA/RNA helicase domain-containing protein [Streptomyces sp. NPDC058451]|uniref:DNA/RNA helicase domain-containing protein n=1 Tax=Streptomyces sp. NPDC058451 TaxID=3346506 RepID=UPI0036514A79